MAQKKILEGVKVLDIGTMIAGPVAATMLAEQGADVIKLEHPGGDPLRKIGPMHKGESLWWQVEGRNKRALSLDLHAEKGQEILRSLVRRTDILIENFRPGTLAKWGLDYESLSRENPRLIMLSISGFGQTGPYATRAAYDRMALAFSGLFDATGYPDLPPVRVGASIADYSAATMGAFACMLALYDLKLGSGTGRHIDLALYETVFRYMDFAVLQYDQLGQRRERMGNLHPASAPGNTFKTRSGRHLNLTVSQDGLFVRLYEAIGRSDIAHEPDYQTHSGRAPDVERLNGVLADWILSREDTEVFDVFDTHGIPYAMILNMDDIFQHEQYQARGNIQRVDAGSLGTIRMQGIVPRMGADADEIRPARRCGEDTEQVLRDELGMDPAEIAALREQGVL